MMRIIQSFDVHTTKSILRIIWHNGPYEFGWYRMFLNIPYPTTSLFLPKVVKVNVSWRSSRIKDGKEIGFIDNSRTYYFPYKLTECGLEIALDDPSIGDALAINGWTKGKKPVLKEYPKSLDVVFGDMSRHFVFNKDNGETPTLLCKPYFSEIEDKKELTISLD